MPLIPKPDKTKKVSRQFKLDERLATLLDRYCSFLESDPDYLLEGLLRIVCSRDREFLEWQAARGLDPLRIPDIRQELIALPAARRKASGDGAA